MYTSIKIFQKCIFLTILYYYYCYYYIHIFFLINFKVVLTFLWDDYIGTQKGFVSIDCKKIFSKKSFTNWGNYQWKCYERSLMKKFSACFLKFYKTIYTVGLTFEKGFISDYDFSCVSVLWFPFVIIYLNDISISEEMHYAKCRERTPYYNFKVWANKLNANATRFSFYVLSMWLYFFLHI